MDSRVGRRDCGEQGSYFRRGRPGGLEGVEGAAAARGAAGEQGTRREGAQTSAAKGVVELRLFRTSFSKTSPKVLVDSSLHNQKFN